MTATRCGRGASDVRATPAVATLSVVLLLAPALAETDTGMHPPFPLLDAAGAPLAAPELAPSVAATCGACHDVEFIHSHGSHTSRMPDEDCLGCHLPGGMEAVRLAPTDAEGRIRMPMGPPESEACGACHGLVRDRDGYVELGVAFLEGRTVGPFGTTLRTGEIFSPQFVSDSFLNLEGKSLLDRPWDLHAGRGLECASCHYAPNNPAKASLKSTRSLAHLINDPRSIRTGAYLRRPDHRLAVAACTACHEPAQAHPRLQFQERHMAALACQACHVSALEAAALRAVDRTVVTAEGGPRMELRGVLEREWNAPNTWLLTGYRPYLLREPTDRGDRFAPYNLVTRWAWVEGEEAREVEPELLRRAWLDADGAHLAEWVELLDGDGDGRLAASELRLETDAEVEAIRARLIALGAHNPRIRGEIQAYPVRHGVVKMGRAAASCDSCHSGSSRLGETIPLASEPFPGGVTPVATPETLALLAGRPLELVAGRLQLSPGDDAPGTYILGHSRRAWSDTLGFVIFVLTVLGVAGHAALRYLGARKRGRRRVHAPTRRVYMYGAYERLWHWTMALCILLLLLTGIRIHFPESFEPLQFRTAIFVHNSMAVVLLVNALLSLFFHLATGEIRQFVPRRAGFFQRVLAQALYYGKGIFFGANHPSSKSPERKLNPLQQITYVGLLNVLFPAQIISGILLWLGGYDPDLLGPLGGLAIIAPLHNLGSWLFAAFLVMHVYLTTTGHTLLSNLSAMVDGWEAVEVDRKPVSTEKGAP